MGDKEHNDKDNAISENKKSYLQLNKGDKDSDIQPLDIISKQSHQDCLTKLTPST